MCRYNNNEVSKEVWYFDGEIMAFIEDLEQELIKDWEKLWLALISLLREAELRVSLNTMKILDGCEYKRIGKIEYSGGRKGNRKWWIVKEFWGIFTGEGGKTEEI